jgi:hypothetical protein
LESTEKLEDIVKGGSLTKEAKYSKLMLTIAVDFLRMNIDVITVKDGVMKTTEFVVKNYDEDYTKVTILEFNGILHILWKEDKGNYEVGVLAGNNIDQEDKSLYKLSNHLKGETIKSAGSWENEKNPKKSKQRLNLSPSQSPRNTGTNSDDGMIIKM